MRECPTCHVRTAWHLTFCVPLPEKPVRNFWWDIPATDEELALQARWRPLLREEPRPRRTTAEVR